MQTVGLTWQESFELAAVLAVGGAAAAVSGSRVVRGIGAFARETAVIGALYGLWQLAGQVSITSRWPRNSCWVARSEGTGRC